MADIAAEAGVSAPTVSKVVNGRSEVALSTRRRVEAVLRRQGYEPRRSLTVVNSALVDLVFHELEGPWAMEIVRGVEEVARSAGVNVVLTDLGGKSRTPDRNWIDRVTARNTRGVIMLISDLSAQQRAQLAARNVPFVVVDPAGEPAADVPSVGATNWNGGLTATRHLLELGHTRIGMIGGPAHMLCSQARIDGYRTALETAGIPYDPRLVGSGDFHVESGFVRAQELLARPDRPTAIFAGNDLQAFGVYEAARHAGLRIPDDLSVVGFDDLPLARWLWPPLTTIRQPLTEMAAAATRLVLARSRGEIPPNDRVELATSLIRRESTGPVTA
ncbi:MAG TPA: LacI family DNA-binding transcriptional regulator [Mycobacteriales bacterium]|nr:LacI family DNA-binding transcriptional regulator [Mycobacteriales bacterium]